MTSTQEAEDYYYRDLLFIESVFMLLNKSVLCIPVCCVMNKY